MGLDVSHGDAHWSYSGFMSFRAELCKVAGHGNLWDYYNEIKNLDEMEDCLRIFFDHSDCDGEFTVEECKILIPRFKELIDKLEGFNKHQMGLLIEGMEEAIAEGVPLEFC